MLLFFKPLGKWLLLATTVFLFHFACTNTEETPDKELSEEQMRKLAEYKAEVELGRNMAGRLLHFYGVYGFS